MSYSVEQPFVLNGVVVILCLLELGYGFHSSHGPVGQFPSLRPPYVHVLRIQDHNYQFEFVVPYRSTQTWPCVWCYSRFDSVDSSLPQHQVSVEPLVVASVSVGILLHIVELRAYDISELLVLHANGR